MKNDELRKKIKEKILSEIDFSKDIDDEEMLLRIDRNILNTCRTENISIEEKVRLRRDIFYSIRKLDVLQNLVDDKDVTEIMVNGTDNIFVEKNGRLSRYDMHFESKEKLEDVIHRIASQEICQKS